MKLDPDSSRLWWNICNKWQCCICLKYSCMLWRNYFDNCSGEKVTVDEPTFQKLRCFVISTNWLTNFLRNCSLFSQMWVRPAMSHSWTSPVEWLQASWHHWSHSLPMWWKPTFRSAQPNGARQTLFATSIWCVIIVQSQESLFVLLHMYVIFRE